MGSAASGKLWVLSMPSQVRSPCYAHSMILQLCFLAQPGISEDVVITENEVGEMYTHLTTEYDKKIKEILSRRSTSCDVSDHENEPDYDRVSQCTPVSVNVATEIEPTEEEGEDGDVDVSKINSKFGINRSITIAELNEKLAARALTENPGFLPQGPLSVKGMRGILA